MNWIARIAARLRRAADGLSHGWEQPDIEIVTAAAQEMAIRVEQDRLREELALTLDPHECRHRVPAIGDSPECEVAYVGWNGDLNTYFLQVGEAGDDMTEIDPRRIVFQVGTERGDVSDINELCGIAWNGKKDPWAQISPAIGAHLEQYRKADNKRRFLDYSRSHEERRTWDAGVAEVEALDRKHRSQMGIERRI